MQFDSTSLTFCLVQGPFDISMSGSTHTIPMLPVDKVVFMESWVNPSFPLLILVNSRKN